MSIDPRYAGLPNQIDRALPVTAVASIEISAVFAAFWWLYEQRGSRWMGLASTIFTVCAIGLQHRTVWAMLTATILCTFMIDRQVMRVLLKCVAWTALAGVLVLAVSSSLRARLSADFEESATNGGTFGWRVESWQRSIDQDGGLLDVLIGQPIGSGYTRLDIDSAGYIDSQPHNEFVNQYLRVGVLGTLLLIAILLRPLWLHRRGDVDDTLMFPGAGAWVTVTVAIIIFGIPYSYVCEIIALSAMANGLTSGEFSLATESMFEESFTETEVQASGSAEPIPQNSLLARSMRQT
jgi:O-antigen ligase